MTAFTGVDSQNLPDVMVSVQFILAIGEKFPINILVKADLKPTNIPSCGMMIVTVSILLTGLTNQIKQTIKKEKQFLWTKKKSISSGTNIKT
ncbi:hypothetical protein [Lactobacillus delbrueckii]